MNNPVYIEYILSYSRGIGMKISVDVLICCTVEIKLSLDEPRRHMGGEEV